MCAHAARANTPNWKTTASSDSKSSIHLPQKQGAPITASRVSITKGIRELSKRLLSEGRIRRAGGSRWRLTVYDPQLFGLLESLVEPLLGRRPLRKRLDRILRSLHLCLSSSYFTREISQEPRKCPSISLTHFFPRGPSDVPPGLAGFFPPGCHGLLRCTRPGAFRPARISDLQRRAGERLDFAPWRVASQLWHPESFPPYVVWSPPPAPRRL